MPYGLSDSAIEQISAVFKRFPSIERVVIYGSRAKGHFKNGSDIDLCLVGKSLDQSTLLQVAVELDELLLPYTFDLSIHHKLTNKDLLSYIDRVGLPFY